MLKKTLISVSIAASSVLGMSSAAFASMGPEPVEALSPAHFYVGGQIGYGWVRLDDEHFYVDNSLVSACGSDEDGLYGRIFAGYDANQYFGAEIGFSKFSEADWNITVKNSNNVMLAGSVDYDPYVFDMLLKGMLPMGNGFSAYVKGGVAYIHSEDDATFINGVKVEGSDDNEFAPKAAIGVNYDIDQTWGVHADYSVIFGRNEINDSNYVPYMHAVSLGASVNFG